MSAEAVIGDDVEVGYWRARAVRAEERLVVAETRICELVEQVAVLSRMLFGQSSEKTRSGSHGDPAAGAEPAGAERPDGAGGAGRGRARGQQPGSKGHGRRDYSHLQTREEVHDVPAGQRVCAGCGQEFEFLGSQCSEQIDWQVTITRVVHRRLRYRRRCGCPGPRTVTAPVPANPVAKGRFTAGFLARLLYQKYVLGVPVHRIVRALAADGGGGG